MTTGACATWVVSVSSVVGVFAMWLGYRIGRADQRYRSSGKHRK